MGVFQCNVFQNNVFQGPCDGVVAEQPRVVAEQQPAGRVYAPVRKRKPERLVFLERELIEAHERRQKLERQAKQAQTAAREAKAEARADVAATAFVLLDAINDELQQINAAIAGLIRDIRVQIERDEDDAIAAIIAIATLH